MIFFLSDLWPPFPGGAERLAFNLARYLTRTGRDVEVLTGYRDAKQFDGPPIKICEEIGVFEHRDAGARIVQGAIERLNPDVIVTHHLYARQFEPELAASGIPYVHVVLNGERLESAAMAVYISNWVAEQSTPQPGDMVIPPPAFADVIADEHGDAIGFVKPIPHKGIEMLYRLANRFPDRKFVVLRGEWQTLEEILPLPNVEFMEPVDDIRDFYRRVRLTLMPSLSEDAGTVAQESTLNGIPCISSNVDGLRETNAGGPQLAPDDFDGFARWIEQLDYPNVYKAIVESQQRALEATDRDGALARFADAIDQLAAG